MEKQRKIVVGITGASGSIYAESLLESLTNHPQLSEVALVMSDNAKSVWKHELNTSIPSKGLSCFNKNDFYAPFASGSSTFDTLIVIPCSMGTMGRIANGISSDLITRTADVMMKERKRLVLVIRETPYSLIHIKNMESITLAGGIICPASPSYYSNPSDFKELTKTVTSRVLDLVDLDPGKVFRWNENH